MSHHGEQIMLSASRLLCNTAVVVALLPGLVAASAHAGDPQKTPEFVPGSWSLALLPDTQNYSEQYPGLFTLQTHWIAKNRDKYNICYAFQLGDITNGNTPSEWRHAREAMNELDGSVPYVIVTGNHDYSDFSLHATTGGRLNEYFPFSTFKAWRTFGGTMKGEDVSNTYHLFTAGGIDWIVIALQWDPGDNVVQWANEVLQKHADRKAILVTHTYLYPDGSRSDRANKKKGTPEWLPHTAEDAPVNNDGEDLWQKLVRKNHFALVFNGHVSPKESGFLSSTNDHGETTHQMFVNYQMRKLGGEGYLRLLEFLPDGKTIHVKSYSPLYDKFLQDAANQFNFRLAP
jgi:hypothetical protein